ncbi:hypothetical protein GJ496_011425 [Pomphorhynchus laevis]|nr:hypothetical protein GJ496_011425 [Pomphorhynchus laevis]
MFCKGKVTASIRCLRAEDKLGSILSLKDTLNCQTVRQRLEQLHPIAQDLNRDLVLELSLQGSVNHREALFSDLDAVQIKDAARRTKGMSTSSEEEVINGLPLRDGGLGIRDHTIDTALKYSRSLRICHPFLTGRNAEECFEEEHSIFKSLRDEESIRVKEKLSTLQDKLSPESQMLIRITKNILSSKALFAQNNRLLETITIITDLDENSTLCVNI